MGRGTLDVSLLTIEDGIFEVEAVAGDTDLGGEDFDNRKLHFGMQDFTEDGIFEVKNAAGDTHLGGEDFDNHNLNVGMQHFKYKYRCKDLARNKRALRCLRTQCEYAKRTFSASTRATIGTDALFDVVDYLCSLSHARF